MSLRDELIHNELQHLGQMLQTLSYELTVLQDFVKDKFGSDYESFRENLTGEQKFSFTTLTATGTSSKSGNTTVRKSTTPRPGGLKRERSEKNNLSENRHKDLQRKHGESESDSSSDEESDDSISVRIESVVSKREGAVQQSDSEENSGNEDGADDDDNSEMEFPVDEKNVKLLMDDELEVNGERMDFSKPSFSKKSRPRSEIWSKFIVTKLASGKLHVRCPICKASVSNKSSRMEKHFKNCRQLVSSNVGTSKDSSAGSKGFSHRMSLADEKRETYKAMRELKKEKRLKISTESRPGGPLGPGRRLDPVWAYFDVTDDSETGKKVAICKQCQSPVSNRVNRLRRHFVICHELEKEEQEQGT